LTGAAYHLVTNNKTKKGIAMAKRLAVTISEYYKDMIGVQGATKRDRIRRRDKKTKILTMLTQTQKMLSKTSATLGTFLTPYENFLKENGLIAEMPVAEVAEVVVTDWKVDHLDKMGFDREVATDALKKTNDDLTLATGMLWNIYYGRRRLLTPRWSTNDTLLMGFGIAVMVLLVFLFVCAFEPKRREQVEQLSPLEVPGHIV